MKREDVIDFFPSKLAIGKAFCNRQIEIKFINENISKCRHTVIYSPRRYGKSSLVNKVVTDQKLPNATIDLFLAHDDQMINKRMLVGISHIVSQILSPSEKMLKKVQDSFTNFKVSLGVYGFSIESSFASNVADTVDQIYEALIVLDSIAKEKNQKVIIFIDEFQDIVNAQSSKSIQGAIRNVAQGTNNIVFIFSGSYQHMLSELFDDKSKPLYMICDKLYLERILSKEYIKHLNEISKIKWNENLNHIVLERILSLTEAHAFYINMLCNILFRMDKAPGYDDIDLAWDQCRDVESRRIVSDIQSLSIHQQDVLRLIAIHNPIEPSGQHFVQISRKAGATIRQSIGVLLKKDFIYRITREDVDLPFIKIGQYRVLDPLMSSFLRKIS